MPVLKRSRHLITTSTPYYTGMNTRTYFKVVVQNSGRFSPANSPGNLTARVIIPPAIPTITPEPTRGEAVRTAGWLVMPDMPTFVLMVLVMQAAIRIISTITLCHFHYLTRRAV